VSQENVEIVRRAFTAYLLSQPPDVDTLREVLDPDVVGSSNWGVEGTEYRGVEGALTALADMNATWGSWEQEIERVLDAGDNGVVVLLRIRARGRESAVPVEFPWAMVATLRGGRIVTSHAYLDQIDALKAAGLEE
jgi:ketosteroid isomerase-like protein